MVNVMIGKADATSDLESDEVLPASWMVKRGSAGFTSILEKGLRYE